MQKYPLDEVTTLAAEIIKETRPYLEKVDSYTALEAMKLVHAIVAKRYYERKNDEISLS